MSAYQRLLGLGSIITLCLTLSCSTTPDKNTPEPRPEPKPLTLQKITSGERNFQQYVYNAQGQLTGFQSDWLYSDSAQSRSILDAAFTYDSQGRMSQITSNGSLYVKFYYEGSLVSKSEEYNHKNRLAIIHYYQFNAEGQLVELIDHIFDPYESSTDPVSYVKHQYEYNGQKNVQRINSFLRKAKDASFKAWLSYVYEGYDNKTNPHIPQIHYPFVAQACTQVNNPGKITIRNAQDQSLVSVETFTYRYNEQGYPIYKTQQLTTSKPLSAITVLYHYK